MKFLLQEFKFIWSLKMSEHGIHFLPCSRTNAVIYVTITTKLVDIYDVIEKITNLLQMVTDLCRHLTYNSKEAWHTVYAMLLLN